MPCHHTLEGYLAEYIERARLAEAGRAPLFQAIRYRAYGRGEAILNRVRLHRANAWAMVRRRARAAGIATEERPALTHPARAGASILRSGRGKACGPVELEKASEERKERKRGAAGA